MKMDFTFFDAKMTQPVIFILHAKAARALESCLLSEGVARDRIVLTKHVER